MPRFFGFGNHRERREKATTSPWSPHHRSRCLAVLLENVLLVVFMCRLGVNVENRPDLRCANNGWAKPFEVPFFFWNSYLQRGSTGGKSVFPSPPVSQVLSRAKVSWSPQGISVCMSSLWQTQAPLVVPVLIIFFDPRLTVTFSLHRTLLPKLLVVISMIAHKFLKNFGQVGCVVVESGWGDSVRGLTPICPCPSTSCWLSSFHDDHSSLASYLRHTRAFSIRAIPFSLVRAVQKHRQRAWKGQKVPVSPLFLVYYSIPDYDAYHDGKRSLERDHQCTISSGNTFWRVITAGVWLWFVLRSITFS